MEVRRGYKQTEVGVIPDDWEVKPLGELAAVTAGGTPSRTNAKYWNGDIPWVTTSEVDFYTIDSAEQFITKEGLNNSAAKLLPPGTLLMALYGQGKTRGKVGILGIEAATNQACAAISLRHSVSREFILYFLASQYDAIRSLSNTGNQENLNSSLVRSISVLLPPKTQQRNIATALSDVDALLEGLTRLIAKKRDLKQAAMQQLLSGLTRLPGFHGEWEVKTLREIVSTPITDGPHLTPTFLEDGVPFLSVNNLVNNQLDIRALRFVSPKDHLEFSKKCKPRKGDILFGKAASVGMVALIETDIELNIWSPLAMIRVGHRASARFVCYALQASHVGRQIKLLTNSSSQGNIGMGEIGLLEIPLPTPDEQSAIAATLSDMDAELSVLEARRDKTHALKQAMMQELLTGRTCLV